MSKLFQINEDDLAELEHTLPQLQSDLFSALANPLALAKRIRDLCDAEEICDRHSPELVECARRCAVLVESQAAELDAMKAFNHELQDAFDIATASLEGELPLRKENAELRQLLCPDCRDKCKGETCLRCQIQWLERQLERCYDAREKDLADISTEDLGPEVLAHYQQRLVDAVTERDARTAPPADAAQQVAATCPACNGKGYHYGPENDCSMCDGKGSVASPGVAPAGGGE